MIQFLPAEIKATKNRQFICQDHLAYELPFAETKLAAGLYHSFLNGGPNSLHKVKQLNQWMQNNLNSSSMAQFLAKYEEILGFENEAANVYTERSQMARKNRKVKLLFLWCASKLKYGPRSKCPTGDILAPFLDATGTFLLICHRCHNL